MLKELKRNLPRLDRHRYQGHAYVFWTLTLEDRATGWLTPAFHALFRELLLHCAARYAVWCPAYCLMQDHLHLLWIGIRPSSDQLNAVLFLRRELLPLLGGSRRWQHQAHDHVLREHERERNALAATCFYIFEHPVRASITDTSITWPYSGSIVPGYPRLRMDTRESWELFWRLHETACNLSPAPPP